jgi:hypothetical protein
MFFGMEEGFPGLWKSLRGPKGPKGLGRQVPSSCFQECKAESTQAYSCGLDKRTEAQCHWPFSSLSQSRSGDREGMGTAGGPLALRRTWEMLLDAFTPEGPLNPSHVTLKVIIFIIPLETFSNPRTLFLG